jgi:uncharacterized protein YraI
MKRILSLSMLGLLLMASTSAFAAFDGYVTASVYLRAGPDSSYPRVARLHAGESIVIEGCVDDWSWCDVSGREDRGWVSAHYLQHEYEGHRVLIPRYGVRIGIPIISFVFGSYWNDHYRSRSWYRDRDRYSRITPRYHGAVRGGSRDGGTYRVPRQSPVSPSRQSETRTPSYQTRPSTTIATPQHRAPAQVRTPARTATPTSSPVERVQSRTAPQQQQRATQQQSRQAAPTTQHRAMAPKASPKQTPARSKSPPAHGAGKDKGNQGGGKGNGKDKNKDKDKGGGGGGNDQR